MHPDLPRTLLEITERQTRTAPSQPELPRVIQDTLLIIRRNMEAGYPLTEAIKAVPAVCIYTFISLSFCTI